jgi:cytochrome c oxidase cbb3-type subunit 1
LNLGFSTVKNDCASLCPFEDLAASIDPRTDSHQSEQGRLAQIDTSLRGPVSFFFAKGLGWLILASLFGFIAAVKMVNPEFLAGHEYLTYGRVFAAAVDAFIYGWGCQAAFAVSLWLMARLCGTQVKHLGVLYIAGAFWNIGVLWGVASIFLGGLTSVPFLEMPPQVFPLLGFSYVMIAMWALLSFHYRRPGPVYVSQWYLLAALLMFPWIGFSAELMIFFAPARGVVQSVVDAWYANSLLWLWFAPVALAVLYYLLPKILGRPIFVYYLSILGFWSLVSFAGWAGTHFLVYGPIPAWLQTVGIVGNTMLLIPAIIVALNLLVTAVADARTVWASPVLRFVVFSAVAFTLAGLVATLSSRGFGIITNLTQFTAGNVLHLLYAVFSMAMFGAAYYILPRVLGREWPSASLIKMHFWCAALGVGVLVLALYYFGWRQGVEINNPEIDFLTTVQNTSTLNRIRVGAGALLVLGHLVFFVNFVWMAAGVCYECCYGCLARFGLVPAAGGVR